ncbi:MAG: hypothetical protein CVU38_05530 [Chloroflexi bacterium HGW-Chloroflexi-1]|nr:MAG: hypothetical protein CVU38_05530 [Chloroflexi bacterium HGW-Chloroflexi-1]
MIEQSITRETIIQKVAGLPPDGLAAVMRFIESWEHKVRPPVSVQMLAAGEHPAFGLWADRTDIQDSAAFAQQLRRTIEGRRDG